MCYAVSVTIMAWTGTHCAFFVESFLGHHFRQKTHTAIGWKLLVYRIIKSLKQKPPGRPPVVFGHQKISLLSDSPFCSPLLWACPVQVVRRILQADLKMDPNEMMVVSRPWLAELNGTVNKQNFCYCAENISCQLHERPIHSSHTSVWCTVDNCGVYGQYFYEEEG